MLGKIEGGRRGRQRMRWLDGITDDAGHEFEQAPGVGDGQGRMQQSIELQRVGHDTTEQLNNHSESFRKKQTFYFLFWPEKLAFQGYT